jgi:hypothetical protein
MESNFNEIYLRTLVKGDLQGDFGPFLNNETYEVEGYIQQMLGRLKDRIAIKIQADFTAYGSGFASYINVKITKKDRSDTTFTKEGKLNVESKKSLLLYISLLSPYWYFGGANWSENYLNGKFQGGSMPFLRPEDNAKYDKTIWQDEIDFITQHFDEYRYRLLTQTELEPYLNFDIEIPTIVADKPYQVFDCFFYWED